MNYINKIAAVMMCAFTLAACGEATQAQPSESGETAVTSSAPVSSADIQDKAWTLKSLNGTDLVADAKITLTLGADGKLTGNAGCNGYSGHYEFAEDQVIKVNPAIVSTMRACAEDIMKQEYGYHQIMGEVTSWAVTPEHELTLKTDGDRILVFTAE